MHIFELCYNPLYHFLNCVSHAVASSFAIKPKDKYNGSVSNFYKNLAPTWSNNYVSRSANKTVGFSRVHKKQCSGHTPTHTTFEQNIPINQGLVTSEMSVLCFLCIYSFPVCESLSISAPSSHSSFFLRASY